MANWYYYNKSGEKVGPITPTALKALAMQGQITPETVIENGNGRTSVAGQVNGLTFPKVTTPLDEISFGQPAMEEVYGFKPEMSMPMPVPPQPVVKQGNTNVVFPIIAKLGGAIQYPLSGIPQRKYFPQHNTEVRLFTLLEIYDNKVILKRGTEKDQYNTQKTLTFSKISALETGTGQIGGVWSPAGKKSNGKTAFVSRTENVGYIQFSIPGGNEQNSTGLMGALRDENSVVFWIGSNIKNNQMEIATAVREFIEAKIEGVDSTEAYNTLVAASRQQPGFRIVERCQLEINWWVLYLVGGLFFAFIILWALGAFLSM